MPKYEFIQLNCNGFWSTRYIVELFEFMLMLWHRGTCWNVPLCKTGTPCSFFKVAAKNDTLPLGKCRYLFTFRSVMPPFTFHLIGKISINTLDYLHQCKLIFNLKWNYFQFKLHLIKYLQTSLLVQRLRFPSPSAQGMGPSWSENQDPACCMVWQKKRVEERFPNPTQDVLCREWVCCV